jgi:predicted outer membrane repeat protein
VSGATFTANKAKENGGAIANGSNTFGEATGEEGLTVFDQLSLGSASPAAPPSTPLLFPGGQRQGLPLHPRPAKPPHLRRPSCVPVNPSDGTLGHRG